MDNDLNSVLSDIKFDNDLDTVFCDSDTVFCDKEQLNLNNSVVQINNFYNNNFINNKNHYDSIILKTPGE